jgi:hypothetical protein
MPHVTVAGKERLLVDGEGIGNSPTYAAETKREAWGYYRDS